MGTPIKWKTVETGPNSSASVCDSPEAETRLKLRNIFGSVVVSPGVLASALGILIVPVGAAACGYFAYHNTPDSWNVLAQAATAVGAIVASAAAMVATGFALTPLTNTYFNFFAIDEKRSLRESVQKTIAKKAFTPRDPYEGTMTPTGWGIILGLAASLYLTAVLPPQISGPKNPAEIGEKTLRIPVAPRLFDPRPLSQP